MNTKNRLVLIAFLSALLIVSKEALSFLPNIELVTLLLILYTNLLGLKTSIYITFIFTTVQALIYPPFMDNYLLLNLANTYNNDPFYK